MGKFLTKIVIFYLLTAICVACVAGVFSSYQPAKRVHDAIEAVENCPYCTKLVLGDSTGEIYDNTNTNDTICIARTNRAITLVGQYLLLNKFLQNSKTDETTQVLLILHPKGLNAAIDDQYSFNYFFQPFFSEIWNNDIPKNISDCITDYNKVRFWLFAFPLLRIVNHNPFPNHRSKTPVNLTPHDFKLQSAFQIPEYTKRTLKAIETLCKEYSVDLKIKAPILSQEWRGVSLAAFKKPFEEHGLGEQIAEYDLNVTFLPSDNFKDGTHLKDHVIQNLSTDPLGFLEK